MVLILCLNLDICLESLRRAALDVDAKNAQLLDTILVFRLLDKRDVLR